MGIRFLIAFPRPHPASASEASSAEREAETITSFAPLVAGIPIPCPVRSEAPARPPVVCGTPAPGRDRARPLPSYRKPSKTPFPRFLYPFR